MVPHWLPVLFGGILLLRRVVRVWRRWVFGAHYRMDEWGSWDKFQGDGRRVKRVWQRWVGINQKVVKFFFVGMDGLFHIALCGRSADR